MTDDEGGEYCLPGYMKDRLQQSYQGEVDYYQKKLDRTDEDTDPGKKAILEKHVVEASDNLRLVNEMAVCDIVDDTAVPAETEPTVDQDPLALADD